MSDALAVCAAVVSADGQVLFGPRSQRIADSPSRPAQACYHVLPSGHPEPPQGLFEGLLMELQEEADINAEELTEAHLTGLIRALPSGKPELTFLLKTDLTLAEIRARSPRDAWEFTALEGFEWSPRGVRLWLEQHIEDAVLCDAVHPAGGIFRNAALLPRTHRFKHRGLGLWCCAVNFICKTYLSKDWTFLESKFSLPSWSVDDNIGSNNICRH